jgi:hypothetical protein
VADLKNEYYHALVLKTADEAVVFDAIPPEAGQIAAQRFAEAPGVLRDGNAFSQVAEDGLLDFGVKFA